VWWGSLSRCNGCGVICVLVSRRGYLDGWCVTGCGSTLAGGAGGEESERV
jgi:hypothetical protein